MVMPTPRLRLLGAEVSHHDEDAKTEEDALEDAFHPSNTTDYRRGARFKKLLRILGSKQVRERAWGVRAGQRNSVLLNAHFAAAAGEQVQQPALSLHTHTVFVLMVSVAPVPGSVLTQPAPAATLSLGTMTCRHWQPRASASSCSSMSWCMSSGRAWTTSTSEQSASALRRSVSVHLVSTRTATTHGNRDTQRERRLWPTPRSAQSACGSLSLTWQRRPRPCTPAASVWRRVLLDV